MKKTKHRFSIGDVVQLNSGGLQFTIQSIKANEITVKWSDGQKLKTESFPAAMLQHASSQKFSDLEIARRIAFILQNGIREKTGFPENKESSLDGMIKRILNDDEE